MVQYTGQHDSRSRELLTHGANSGIRQRSLALVSHMDAFTVNLPEDQAQRLRELAREAGVSPEQLLCVGIDEWLKRPDQDFATAAAYVLRKNKELYRRLA